jgi:hypothetical protein
MVPVQGYIEGLRKVLSEAVYNANYRRRLLNHSREEARAAINQLVSDEESQLRILNVLYGETGNNYVSKEVSSEDVIKLMAFVCSSLKATEELPVEGGIRANYFPLSANVNGEYFGQGNDWEQPRQPE